VVIPLDAGDLERAEQAVEDHAREAFARAGDPLAAVQRRSYVRQAGTMRLVTWRAKLREEFAAFSKELLLFAIQGRRTGIESRTGATLC